MSSAFSKNETSSEPLPIAKPAFAKPAFDDELWNSVFHFIQEHAKPEEVFVLPDEFCSFFANAYAYDQILSDDFQQFDWVLLHKDKLSDLTPQSLSYVCSGLKPVLANEVFVLFSRSQTVPEINRKQPHLRSFWLDVQQLKIQQIFNNLSNIRQMLDRKLLNRDRHSGTNLIERNPKYTGWFTGEQESAVVPLSWVSTSPQHPFANLGDALSPVIVSALSGMPIVHRNFESWKRRLACVGTIGHGFKYGTVHFWGTGVDPRKNPIDPSLGPYRKPPKTTFHVHALRGPFTARTFRNQEIEVPEVYGDPVWFLPALIKPAVEKRYELGVIVHLSELTELTDTAVVKETLVRYKLPPSLADTVHIITTLTQPNFPALEQKVQEITSCKRIVSTSLHGLVIAETYGIPCVLFRSLGDGAALAKLDEDKERVDLRVRDFYSGAGVKQLFVYGQRRGHSTNWEDVIAAIDTHWKPLEWSPEPFLEAFPLPLAFNPLQEEFTNRSLFQQISF